MASISYGKLPFSRAGRLGAFCKNWRLIIFIISWGSNSSWFSDPNFFKAPSEDDVPKIFILIFARFTGLVGKSLGNHGFFPMKYSEILGHKQIAFQSSVKGIVSMSKLEVSSMSYCVYIYIYICVCACVLCNSGIAEGKYNPRQHSTFQFGPCQCHESTPCGASGS